MNGYTQSGVDRPTHRQSSPGVQTWANSVIRSGDTMYLRHATVFGLALLLTLLLQWRGNAYQAEWSGDSDEAAHYVTGLMVRDYIASGLPGSPMSFAQRYYDHYPRVAIGH